MMNIADYLIAGLKNTLRLKKDKHFSYSNSWKQVYTNTVIDEFFVGDFLAAEYTIVVDVANNAREIIKCSVVAGVNVANLTIYGRANLGTDLIDLTATVNNSKVSLLASPANGAGHKCYFTANYYYSINQLSL
jgi:hypothetical protein